MEINVNCPNDYKREFKELRTRPKPALLLSVCTNGAHKGCIMQSCDEGLWVGQKQCHSTTQAMARDSQSHHTSKKPFEVMKFPASKTESIG